MAEQQRYWRKIIRITAEDSPHVRRGLALERQGYTSTAIIEARLDTVTDDNGTPLFPGVIDYATYKKRRAIWDEVRQAVGLDAEFWAGREVRLYPPQWLQRAVMLARQLYGQKRHARAIGIDPGEGSAETAWAVVDELGLIEMVAKKTPDTSVITGDTLALMRKYNIPPEYVCFDRGGGGKEHADRLRRQGFRVRTVSFGEPLLLPIKYGDTQVKDRIINRDERYSYFNRRAEMYGTLRNLLDPINKGFALPAEYVRLRRQLIPIPLTYDEEGRLKLPPKTKRDPESKKPCLIDIIGCSPDQADALVVAIYAMTHKPAVARAGGIA